MQQRWTPRPGLRSSNDGARVAGTSREDCARPRDLVRWNHHSGYCLGQPPAHVDHGCRLAGHGLVVRAGRSCGLFPPRQALHSQGCRRGEEARQRNDDVDR